MSCTRRMEGGRQVNRTMLFCERGQHKGVFPITRQRDGLFACPEHELPPEPKTD